MTRDDAFLQAADAVLALVARPEVAARWSEPSALPQLSVGALAVHLGNQVVRAAQVVALDPADLPVLADADEHYARSAWPTAAPEDAINDHSRDETAALDGPDALHDRVVEHRETFRDALTSGAARDVVPVPWAGWAMRREDFLLTRLLEVVVHTDDLAVSVGIDTPTLPTEVFDPVRDLLARLAVARHGQARVVAALTRRERAQPIHAF
ncbi:maleylpyruvate isomerase N-terminal domain-containing protein [Cellulomonas dongxiuzhuiae]|uniref:Maleylpyruvate isomerase N-terminal domain-containing protein n=1 Tax=Cellulomonas dongxiuzhuiae TaxID=2819979 RepID=A0ABX8GJZ3_9CELL|nr:maleylpyruvate isomerase N-terminal domain-containing protein [Cellulomonas dongxiuzhuiae]MBO3095346.1 maleylpyruvate isomerase N-terminal domain-containing protein [Cellulomonas dongxiuzhuiae]QWC16335.1 maleylpyruvate isomerase N-terminal domain-containing protein [Cellulomonas dongxiuzhuiae]